MATSTVDLRVSGFGWLELTGNIAPFWYIADTDADNSSTLTYTLARTDTGAVVASGTISPAGVISGEDATVYVGNLTPSVALAVGVAYRERITGAIGGVPVLATRDAYATSYPMRRALISDETLRTLEPILGRYPPGRTSWFSLLQAAHYVVCQRAIRLARADILTPSLLVEPESELAVALALEGLGVFAERAKEHRDRFELLMQALQPDIDTDGDGDMDERVTQSTAAMGPAADQPRV